MQAQWHIYCTCIRIYFELFKDLSLTFFFFVGWSILAWRKSISFVCWEMVPSIFTFSWEYTACRKEQDIQRGKQFEIQFGKIYFPSIRIQCISSLEKMCKFPTSFTLVTFSPSVCKENLILPGMERIFYLYILQLVLQVSPLSLQHVCLV